MILPEKKPLEDVKLFFVVSGLVFLGLLAFVAMNQVSEPAPVAVVPATVPTPVSITTLPTPAPIPTLDWTRCEMKDNCYHLRNWTFWFRRNSNNFGEDLRSWFTVYDYRMMKSYHYHSVSWNMNFKETALPGWKYLFIFVNLYSDGDDARQYVFPKHLFNIQCRDQLYTPEDEYDPTLRITEFDNLWDYAHVQSPVPYPYKIVQDRVTGIYRAEEQVTLYSGRSNAVDGYILYEIPESCNLSEIKVAASLRDLGGMAYWKLV